MQSVDGQCAERILVPYVGNEGQDQLSALLGLYYSLTKSLETEDYLINIEGPDQIVVTGMMTWTFNVHIWAFSNNAQHLL